MQALAERLMGVVREHYCEREIARGVVYEVLAALAFVAATTLKATDNDPEAEQFFEDNVKDARKFLERMK